MLKEPTKQQKKELVKTCKIILKLHESILKLDTDKLKIKRSELYDFEQNLCYFFNNELHKNYYKFLKDLKK